jgi:hypothetical protein
VTARIVYRAASDRAPDVLTPKGAPSHTSGLGSAERNTEQTSITVVLEVPVRILGGVRRRGERRPWSSGPPDQLVVQRCASPRELSVNSVDQLRNLRCVG